MTTADALMSYADALTTRHAGDAEAWRRAERLAAAAQAGPAAALGDAIAAEEWWLVVAICDAWLMEVTR